jgi:hypothetical protein
MRKPTELPLGEAVERCSTVYCDGCANLILGFLNSMIRVTILPFSARTMRSDAGNQRPSIC